MRNKVVFITGAARGIGLALAREFAGNGATVVISDLQNESMADAAAVMRASGLDIRSMVCDVTDETQLTRALNEAYGCYGRIDVLINNAGLQYVSPVEEFPVDKFRLLLAVMLTAPFVATRHVFPLMKKQGYGRIINMASVNGLIGFAGKAAYNSAKHGVIGLTKVTALEGAEYGITVNALCPGYVDTELVRGQLADIAKIRNISTDQVLQEVIYPLVPQKRLLTAEEIAKYALFLCSDMASGITGQAVVIDGGYTAQ